MPPPYVFHTFFENFFALIVKGHNVRDAGRGRRLILLSLFCKFLEVEIVASSRDAFAFLQRPIADRHNRQAWWNGEGLLYGANYLSLIHI